MQAASTEKIGNKLQIKSANQQKEQMKAINTGCP